MTIFGNFDFLPNWVNVRKYALSKSHPPEKTPVACEVYPIVFDFLYT